jgi:acetyl esterase/lipase
MGFSAGGHLAAMAALMPQAADASASDPVDRVDSRPDFLILGYPWLNAMQKDEKGLAYCSVLKLAAEDCRSFDQYSPYLHVNARVPTTFMYHTTTDELVPVDASVIFYRALAAAGVDVEMHLFAKGIHGSGLGMGDPVLDQWPALLELWMRGRGLLPAVSAPPRR